MTTQEETRNTRSGKRMSKEEREIVPDLPWGGERERERESEHKQRTIKSAKQENEGKCTIANKDAIIQTCRNKIIIEIGKVNREIQTDRATDKETDREIDIETDRVRERWTKERSGARDHSFMSSQKAKSVARNRDRRKLIFSDFFKKRRKW